MRLALKWGQHLFSHVLLSARLAERRTVLTTASQGDKRSCTYQKAPVIRGHHAFIYIWTPASYWRSTSSSRRLEQARCCKNASSRFFRFLLNRLYSLQLEGNVERSSRAIPGLSLHVYTHGQVLSRGARVPPGV